MLSFVESGWYRGDRRWWILLPLLLPLSALIWVLSQGRRRWLSARAPVLSVPILVVGNISLGGTGKTPLIAALVQHLRAHGWSPGIVSRGYGGNGSDFPQLVTPETDAIACGDEPALLVKKTGAPLAIDPVRNRAVNYLLSHTDCDVILSDDGLQHYALRRDVEIAVVDGQRGLGNHLVFPAGPLREGASRLTQVDYCVMNRSGPLPAGLSQLADSSVEMFVEPTGFINVATGEQVGLTPVMKATHWQACCGIGNPQRFFASLADMGLAFTPREFPDHHAYSQDDFNFTGSLPVLMTEKDAVKCQAFARDNWWYLAVEARLPLEFIQSLNSRLRVIQAVKLN